MQEFNNYCCRCGVFLLTCIAPLRNARVTVAKEICPWGCCFLPHQPPAQAEHRQGPSGELLSNNQNSQYRRFEAHCFLFESQYPRFEPQCLNTLLYVSRLNFGTVLWKYEVLRFITAQQDNEIQRPHELCPAWYTWWLAQRLAEVSIA